MMITASIFFNAPTISCSYFLYDSLPNFNVPMFAEYDTCHDFDMPIERIRMKAQNILISASSDRKKTSSMTKMIHYHQCDSMREYDRSNRHQTKERNYPTPRFIKHSRPHRNGRHYRHPHQDQQIVLKPRVKYPQYPPSFFRSPFDMSTMRTTLPATRRARESPAAMQKRVMQEMLRLHNYHRAHHCARPLVISDRLNQTAQSYAEQLAATSKFEHSHMKLDGENLGENLYMSWISFGPVKVDPKAAVKSWYDEIALHDFDNPKFSTQTGHFTQMVWRGSKKLGVGVAISPNGREVYMVTHYFPAGNITNAGYFQENVLPPNC